jgi:hypothetical protein
MYRYTYCKTCKYWKIDSELAIRNFSMYPVNVTKEDIENAPCDYCRDIIKVVETHRGRFRPHKNFGCIYHEESHR